MSVTRIYLQSEINRLKMAIIEKEKQLADNKQKKEAMDSFKTDCNRHIDKFYDSIGRRKERVKGINDYTASLKFAAGYKAIMDKLLYGSEFRNAVSQIDGLMNAVANQTRIIESDILDNEQEIKRLKNRLNNLKYQLDNLEEETE